MKYNHLKLIVIGLLVVVLIIAMIFGLEAVVGVPVLTLLVGYLVGNADVTDNQAIIIKE